ncbi:UrcA family protein [Novosphingobium hassiacum]|uniref:UrcA family protein n=1 Tax=Novosphingobium hassiacum TaxID=173676 RepID=A0A7W6EV97_9SPHN|nr:UrcA family protein [Novosphingobium hassiacum]MBB3859745.1 UrcA family protein [Novosphingobium hassiacum]
MIRTSVIAASLVGLALSASQPAFAETRSVGYADLDLSTASGKAQLDARLKGAAKDVCGMTRKDASSAELELARQCFAKSYADARRAKADIRPTAFAAK